jgi:hypothetical protein
VSFWPFALTEEDRVAGDPRPSIEVRYPTQEDYVEKAAEAAAKLRQQGFMLQEDEMAAVQRAQQMVWPPVPTNGYPFWQMLP